MTKKRTVTKKRTINLTWHMIVVQDGEVSIEGYTESGAVYVVKLKGFDSFNAQYAIRKFAELIAEDIAKERRHHKWLRDVVASGYRKIDAAIKEETP